ncbi:transposase [Flavipsychrobacter stenotrophus]|uniref:Transposase n=1 Tax=Flavipsychrobacter stenotrophus TaxID=2077091 RepID=A0A2S7T0Z5_9BACT|nr:recombinase family protein [Flavipsychrobacter stenotrophus]PQJ12634.1 transposase [Flavipsychrobacter stenotrophus]
MKVLYTRISTIDQNTDRQRVNAKDFRLVVEDKCSGAIPFFEREGGKEILKYLNEGILTSLSVWEIDRLGRDLRDVLNTIYYFNERGITIYFINQGLKTLDESGKENPISKLIISILGIVGEMERTQIKERQKEGIRIAKLKGLYKGRKAGNVEDVHAFLNKPQNKKVIDLLKLGLSAKDAASAAKVHANTVTKIKKHAFPKGANK